MSRHQVNFVRSNFSLIALAIALMLALVGVPAWAGDDSDSDSDSDSDGGGFCSTTAELQFYGCKTAARSDFLITKAICTNLEDEDERDECEADSRQTRQEEKELCRDQHEARLEVCDALGEDRFDPDFDPEGFVDEFSSPVNPYYPIAIGRIWEYESGDETIVVEVLNETKLIDGVTCVVVNDVVRENGEFREDTDDWFAQRPDGTVDYCGEIVTDFESFDGDMPAIPELIAIDGSFKAGRDGDKSGTLFLGTPTVGALYRQEWSASNAEDIALVLSTTYSYGNDPELDASVPEDLADYFCGAGDCVVTRDFSPLDPGPFEHKFYANGIGLFLETKPQEGEFSRITGCNFDARCNTLP